MGMDMAVPRSWSHWVSMIGFVEGQLNGTRASFFQARLQRPSVHPPAGPRGRVEERGCARRPRCKPTPSCVARRRRGGLLLRCLCPASPCVTAGARKPQRLERRARCFGAACTTDMMVDTSPGATGDGRLCAPPRPALQVLPGVYSAQSQPAPSCLLSSSFSSTGCDPRLGWTSVDNSGTWFLTSPGAY
jgi:hypothetical protein